MQTFLPKTLGWNEFFQEQIRENVTKELIPGRISAEHRERYEVLTEKGPRTAEISGKMLFEATASTDFPKTGDWVLLSCFDDSSAIIHRLLDRKNAITRNAAGQGSQEQVLAANVDTVFIVTGLDGNYNPSRIERFLVNTHIRDVETVVLLSKSDLIEDPGRKVREIEAVSSGAPVIAYSALNGSGLEDITTFLKPGKTSVFLGSSGAGKSTLINALFGTERLKTGVVRKDSKGKHTTVTRELILSETYGLLIDTPGVRELQLGSGAGGIDDIFSEIADLAGSCRYQDCTHTVEPGCAVIKAVNDGLMPEKRYKNYLKMKKEIAHYETEADIGKKLAEKKKWKGIHKEIKRMKDNGYLKKR